MSQHGVGHRPGYILLIVVLTVLSGVSALVSGVLLIVTRDSAVVESAASRAGGTSVGAGALLVLGLVQLAVGLAYLAVARGLLRGDPRARTVVMVIAVLSFLSGIWSFLSATSSVRPSVGVSVVVAAGIIALLSTDRSKEFFGITQPVITIPPS